jgi:hypothetical protein
LDHLITVIVGAPSLAQHLPSGHVLVIDASARRLDAIRSSGGVDHNFSFAEAVLTEQAGDLVEWHCYSDNRLDGVLPADQWQALFPNVIEVVSKTISGQRLDDLLDVWMREITTVKASPDRFRLILRQGNPLSALGSLGHWDRRLQRVELSGSGAEQLWGLDVDVWLRKRGFASVAEQPLVWERDTISMDREALISERDGLKRRVDDLEQRLNQITSEIEAILTIMDSLSPELSAASEVSS